MDRPSRAPLYVGAVLVVCGWVAIGLGWWQAGRQDLETGQLPFVISGGFGGFGLLLMGAIAVLIDFVRQAEWGLRRSAEDLHERMEEVIDTFVAGRPRPVGEPGAPRPRRRRRRRSPAERPEGSSKQAR
jgi:hypothetical protein